MTKRVYISADYDSGKGDRIVVDELNKWGNDDFHKVDFVDMAKVVSGSVSNYSNCRICDLKAEFNRQINAASAAIFIVGDKTATRTAGASCKRMDGQCFCTPYKENIYGIQNCKYDHVEWADPNGDVGYINSWSYLEHEFRQAVRKGKKIIIFYNSTRKESNWLPGYMSDYAATAMPFWVVTQNGNRIGNYQHLKTSLGYE
jgi:hypothetical protein